MIENVLQKPKKERESISSPNLIENRLKEIVYYGDNNMIDCLPKEMLSHVTSFLPPKDFNSLVRTNKTTRSRLNYRDRQPIRIDMRLRYEYDDEEKKLTSLDASISCFTGESFKWFEFTIEEPKLSTGTKKEPMGTVADWYYNASLDRRQQRTIYSNDIQHTLLTHLQFLISNNALIGQLNLVDAKENELDGISIFFKKNRMRVNVLKLKMEVLGDHHMGLIRVCRPISLFISNTIVPSIFHDDPVIRQIGKLFIYSHSIEMKKGDLAAYYWKESLVLWKIEGVTFADMKFFIQQWSKSPKLRQKLTLYVANEDPESTCNQLVAKLDCRRVEVTAYDEMRNTTRMIGFSLRRIEDGRVLVLGRKAGGPTSTGVLAFADRDLILFY